MPRALVWSLYAALVLIWSSTWVVIKIGLEDVPPLLGAGIRFAVAGVGLLVAARALGRSLRTDAILATTLATLPFAAAYGLIYWGEQYVPSGLAAVLFGVMPLYSATIASLALADEPLHARLVAGIAVAIGGLALAFGESLALGDAEWALLAAIACAVAPLAAAIGNVAIKRRGAALDAVVLNGWAMLGGGLLLLRRVGPDRGLGERGVDGPGAGLDRVPGRHRVGADVRDAHDPAARAAGRDGLLHHAAAAVRGAGVRRRALRRAGDGRGGRGRAARGERARGRAVAAPPRGGRLGGVGP